MISRRALFGGLVLAGCAHGSGSGPYGDWVNVKTYSFSLFTDTSPALTGLHPANPQSAFTLGNKGRIPAPAEVLETLAKLGIS